jgi:hypothetical protein
MRTFVKTVLVGAPLLLASAADAEAQRLQLVPRAGIFVSGGNLAEVSGTLGDVEADMKGTLGVGLGLEVGVPLSPIGFRAGFDYATNSKLSLKGISAGEDEAGAKLLAVTGDVVLRPLPRLIVVQPYLVGGAGVKRYDFELSELEADAQGLFPEDQTDFTLHGGAGVDISLGPLALRAEVSDYVSWFELDEGGERKMQNDIFATLGLRLQLF